MKLISIFSTRKRILLVFALLLISLAACEGTPYDEASARYWATQSALGTVPPPGRQTAAAQYLGLRLTPTPAPFQTPTMSFYEFSGTQVAQQQAVGMTQQANQLQLERERLAAEQRAAQQATQAYYAQETAAAIRIEMTAQARATFMQGTANAEGTQVMNTAAAAATSTMYVQQLNQQNTVVAAAATSQILPTHAIWTQNAVNALATIEQGEADKVALAVRRQEMKNVFDAYLPWLIIVGAIIVLARGFAEFVKTRVHSRDEHGRVPLLQMKADNGDTIVIKPELMESSTMKIQKDGAVIRYSPVDGQEQSDINRRAAAIEAIAALPTPYAQTGAKIVTSEFNSTRARVTIGNPASMGSVLDEADRGFLEEAKNE